MALRLRNGTNKVPVGNDERICMGPSTQNRKTPSALLKNIVPGPDWLPKASRKGNLWVSETPVGPIRRSDRAC